MDDVLSFIRGHWGYLVTVAPGVFAMWRQWLYARRMGRKERSDLIQIAQRIAGEMLESLEKRVKELEAELSLLRKEHAETVTAKDAKITLLEGQLRQALATVDAFDRLLTEQNIPHEKPFRPFWEIEAGKVTPMGAPL